MKNLLKSRILTIVSEEETAGSGAVSKNPEQELNEVSTQPTEEVAEGTEPTNNEGQTSVEPKAESSDKPNVSLSATNPDQVELTPELLATLLGFLRCGVKTKMRALISFQDSKNDIKLVYVKGNRNVYGSQIDKLWKDVKDLKVKRFSRSCVVVNAVQVLKNNPKIKLIDICGNKITLETLGVEKCWAVIDGQHRLMVCLEHPEVDLDLELMDYGGDVMELIKIFNSTDKNWGITDYNKSNIATGKVKEDLAQKMAEIQSVITCSDKVAAYLPTFKKDAIKKSDCIKGEDNSCYTEEKGERGLGIAKAIRYKFGEMTIKVEFIDALIAAYNSLEDGKHSDLADLMIGCIAEMSDSMVKALVSKIDSKDFGIVKNTLTEEFKKYYDRHKDDVGDHIKEVQKKIDEAVPVVEPSKKPQEDLKDGFPGDILKQRLSKAIEATEEKMKSLTKREADFKKTIDTIKDKSKPTEKDADKLAETEAKLSEVQSSLVVVQANLDELKKQQAAFDKAA